MATRGREGAWTAARVLVATLAATVGCTWGPDERVVTPEDSGPEAPPVPCPVETPISGDTCTKGLECEYPRLCGTARAVCVGTRWRWYDIPTCPPQCLNYVPVGGTKCAPVGLFCDFYEASTGWCERLACTPGGTTVYQVAGTTPCEEDVECREPYGCRKVEHVKFITPAPGGGKFCECVKGRLQCGIEP